MRVITGALQSPDGKLLLGRRSGKRKSLGFWEFPGGKQETNETDYETLIREWQEELHMQVIPKELLACVNSPKFSVLLYRVDSAQTPSPGEAHDQVGWFTSEEIQTLRTLPLLSRLLKKANLNSQKLPDKPPTP